MIRNLLAIALVLTAGVATAEESAKHAKAVDISKYDTNKDGALSKEEIAAITDEKVKTEISALDADKDGAVSAEEAKAAKAK